MVTLTYASQNETPSLRSTRRAKKIRMRLGASLSFAEPFPEKPPGMLLASRTRRMTNPLA